MLANESPTLPKGKWGFPFPYTAYSCNKQLQTALMSNRNKLFFSYNKMRMALIAPAQHFTYDPCTAPRLSITNKKN